MRSFDTLHFFPDRTAARLWFFDSCQHYTWLMYVNQASWAGFSNEPFFFINLGHPECPEAQDLVLIRRMGGGTFQSRNLKSG